MFEDTNQDYTPDLITALLNNELMGLFNPQARQIQRRNPEPEDDYEPVPQKSTSDHVLEFLNYFTAPQRGLAGAAYAASRGLPILDTAYKSFSGEKEYFPSDVLGMPKSTPKDDIWKYLDKEGQRLAVDTVIDPLNLLALPIKGVTLGTKAIRAAQIPKALDWLHGTSTGKALIGRLSDTPENRIVEDAINYGMREGGLKKQDALELMQAAKKAQGEAVTQGAGTPSDLRLGWEAAPESVPQAVGQRYGAQKQLSEELARRQNELGLPLGYDPIDMVPEGGPHPANYVPLIQKEGAIRKGVARPESTGPGADIGMRTLRTVLDPAAEGRAPLLIKGKPQVVKTNYDELEPLTKAEIKRAAKQGLDATHMYKGQAVKLGLPTQAEIERAIPGGLDFVTGAPESYALNSSRKAQRIGFLEAVTKAEESGQVVNVTKQWIAENYPNFADLAEDVQKKIIGIARREAPVPKGMRKWNIPGLEDLASRKSVANRYENLAVTQFDKDTPLGSIGSGLQHFFGETSAGRFLKDLKSTWVNTTLPLHPGWQIGNISTNQPLEWMGGVSPLMIPVRNAQMAALQRGSDVLGEAIPGYTQAESARQMAARNVRGPGALFGMDEGPRDILQQALTEGNPSDANRFFQYSGLPEDYASKAALPFEKLGAAQDLGYKVGASLEENAKGAVFIDYLRKQLKGQPITSLDPEAQALLLDRAAEHAKVSLVDPSYLTPFVKQLRNVAPFVGWSSSILGKTAETAAYQPWKMAQMSRGLDALFTPLSDEEKAVAPDYLKESGPIKGILGQPLSSLPWVTPDPEGNPMVAGTGRYNPFGTAEQAFARPFDFLAGMIAPQYKSVVELGSNRSAMKNRQIDEIAGGFPASVINPIVGKPYQLGQNRLLGMDVPASVEYIASQLPGGRYASEVGEFGRALGIFDDPNKRPTSGPETLMWWITGGKTYPYDEEKAGLAARRKDKMKENTVKYLRKRAAMLGNVKAEGHYEQVLDQLGEARDF